MTIDEFLEVIKQSQPIDMILPLTEDTSYDENSGFKTNVRCVRKCLSFLDKTITAKEKGEFDPKCRIYGWVHGGKNRELVF